MSGFLSRLKTKLAEARRHESQGKDAGKGGCCGGGAQAAERPAEEAPKAPKKRGCCG